LLVDGGFEERDPVEVCNWNWEKPCRKAAGIGPEIGFWTIHASEWKRTSLRKTEGNYSIYMVDDRVNDDATLTQIVPLENADLYFTLEASHYLVNWVGYPPYLYLDFLDENLKRLETYTAPIRDIKENWAVSRITAKPKNPSAVKYVRAILVSHVRTLSICYWDNITLRAYPHWWNVPEYQKKALMITGAIITAIPIGLYAARRMPKVTVPEEWWK